MSALFSSQFVASKITPPLRGSRQDKDKVRSRAGGGAFILESPPTDSAFAQNARPHRQLLLHQSKLTLKGGVIHFFISSPGGSITPQAFLFA